MGHKKKKGKKERKDKRKDKRWRGKRTTREVYFISL